MPSRLRRALRQELFPPRKAIRWPYDFAVVELTLHYKVEGKQVDRRGVSVFEFREGKIVRLAE